MAIQMASYSKAVQKRVDELLAVSDRWAKGVDKQAGAQFNVFASTTTPGVFYRTRFDGRGCTCPAARKSRTGICCHRIAVRIVTERVQEQAARPSKRYEDLWIGDGSQLTDAF